MILNRELLLLLALPLSALLASCGVDGAASQVGEISTADDLRAGLEIMGRRVSRTEEAYGRIEPTPTFRFFMHPLNDKDALIEFDTVGLKSITLSPRMGDLTEECLRSFKAGVVRLTWSLDGGATSEVVVDRDYRALIPLDVSNSQRLLITVNNSNGVITCDWFGLGFVNVIAG